MHAIRCSEMKSIPDPSLLCHTWLRKLFLLKMKSSHRFSPWNNFNSVLKRSSSPTFQKEPSERNLDSNKCSIMFCFGVWNWKKWAFCRNKYSKCKAVGRKTTRQSFRVENVFASKIKKHSFGWTEQNNIIISSDCMKAQPTALVWAAPPHSQVSLTNSHWK